MNREAIYNKCHGHCAYCGTKITIEEMQIDHIHPRVFGGSNELENLLPACQKCNFYKGANDLEGYRLKLTGGEYDNGGWGNYRATGLHERLRKLPKTTTLEKTKKRIAFMNEIARRYGVNESTPFGGVFYFEKLKL